MPISRPRPGTPLPPPGHRLPPPQGYPPPPDLPPPGPQQTRTNPFAVVSLVLGIIGGSVLAIVFGVVALRQIGERGGKGRGMAIAGIVLSIIYIVIAGVLFLFLVILSNAANDIVKENQPATGTTSPASVSPTPSGNATASRVLVFDLKDGDCFDNSTAADQEVMSVTTVPCTQPHDAEVLLHVKVPGKGAYPGEQKIADQVEQLCVDKATARIERSPLAKQLGIFYFYPTKQSWANGDRDGTCVAIDHDDGKLAAPVGK